ncbi:MULTISPECIES: malonyl-ACP O-methyltransferase BioC [unclassified Halomonas]|uniref:malonyl-ACP O-methyltransferase BioC n=1 Tax=unclassified Halomonas TaxID=2609666 RepID=UPI0007DA2A91|nr:MULTISPECIES: malonyl-ACP O-methyltransferase BioC [unclassified Halomonas]MBT2786814.1 malonyl-ACP O-methyltransferase BioC [Halomonas sp. ISL-106]MBT2798533.1 malonyl-ACP O-methyltransferase BioC [Halomonas sp. ISL-104]OAL58097.1 malonyl-[acyl-carrier protein] O-methyltransferase BioC [Halomonas sp. ALS9]
MNVLTVNSDANWQARVAHAFSRAAPRYDALASAQRQIGHRLWDSLPDHAYNILDMGCGPGYWTHQLTERYPCAQITGLDLAPGMLAQARQRYGDAIQWQQGDAAALPFDKHAFDLVFSNVAVQWCRDIGAVMEELYRVLAPGGQAHITTLLPGTLEEIACVWQRPEALLQPPNHARVEQAIGKSGLTIHQQTDTVERFYYPDLQAVMASIKGVGAQLPRPNTRLTRTDIAAAKARYEQLRQPEGLPVSYHCLTLQLEKPL